MNWPICSDLDLNAPTCRLAGIRLVRRSLREREEIGLCTTHRASAVRDISSRRGGLRWRAQGPELLVLGQIADHIRRPVDASGTTVAILPPSSDIFSADRKECVYGYGHREIQDAEALHT